MIALLKGTVEQKSTDGVVVDVGGVGYHVSTTLTTFEKLPQCGEPVTLHIYTHVREDTLALYGFFTKEEKELFQRLLKVNGIGPKLALSVLSGVPPADFVSAVLGEDMARLNAIPGVGKKTAERIIIDLKDKLAGFSVTQHGASHSFGRSQSYEDALSALVNLGYKQAQAEKALGKIGVANGAPLTKIIKDALKELAS